MDIIILTEGGEDFQFHQRQINLSYTTIYVQLVYVGHLLMSYVFIFRSY